MFKYLGILLAIALAPSNVFAASSALQNSKITTADLNSLAQQKQWSQLLHYRLHPYSGRHISQNDSANFFLAVDGKKSLSAELSADIDAFLHTNMADNTSAQCKFPARYFWLKTQLPSAGFVDQPCSQFEQWRTELNARFITVIFPAAHINSPSSMYGHTLVRLDRAAESSSKLLAYSVNFAANADPTDNELVFSWKGLSGGYPGVVSVLPYYAKTNEYSHMEYRDIWEYRLNLSAAEVDQFVRHIWETQDTYFDYFFFDENCSYRLLALLDASSERVDVTDQFVLEAKPVDTIRALQQAGLVESVEYRASAASDMEFQSTQASAQVLATARLLVDSDESIEQILQGFTVQEQIRSLELSYSYARYLAVKKKQASPRLRARTLALLSARAKFPESAEFSPTPTPEFRDDQGHKTTRLVMTLGQARVADADANQNFADLSFRAAYHDVMDLPQGFAQGAQIQMGQVDLRLWEGGHARLQQFKVVDVLSLSQQTYFQRPTAWAVSGGLERFVGADAELYGYLKLGFGRAYLNSFGRFYGLAEAQLLADNQFHRGAQLSLGPRLGWLWQGQQLQAQIEGNYQGLAMIDTTRRAQVGLNLGWHLFENGQLRLSGRQQWLDQAAGNTRAHEVSVGLQWYF